MFATQQDYLIYAHLHSLLHKPFHTVGILCGRHGQNKITAPVLRLIRPFQYLYSGMLGMRICYDATVHMPLPVDGLDFVTLAHAQHTATVCGLILGQCAGLLYAGGIKTYHFRLDFDHPAGIRITFLLFILGFVPFFGFALLEDYPEQHAHYQSVCGENQP